MFILKVAHPFVSLIPAFQANNGAISLPTFRGDTSLRRVSSAPAPAARREEEEARDGPRRAGSEQREGSRWRVLNVVCTRRGGGAFGDSRAPGNVLENPGVCSSGERGLVLTLKSSDLPCDESGEPVPLRGPGPRSAGTRPEGKRDGAQARPFSIYRMVRTAPACLWLPRLSTVTERQSIQTYTRNQKVMI